MVYMWFPIIETTIETYSILETQYHCHICKPTLVLTNNNSVETVYKYRMVVLWILLDTITQETAKHVKVNLCHSLN